MILRVLWWSFPLSYLRVAGQDVGEGTKKDGWREHSHNDRWQQERFGTQSPSLYRRRK